MSKEREPNLADKLQFIKDYCECPTLEVATNAAITHVYRILREHQDYLEGEDNG